MSTILMETLAVGLGTYLIRAVSLSFGSRVAWPAWATEWLSFVTPAVLGALLGPILLLHNNHWIPVWHNTALMAAIPTALVAWWSRRLLWTVAAGVVCYGTLIHLL